MNGANEATEIAIHEGGYGLPEGFTRQVHMKHGLTKEVDYCVMEIWLDPLFWQALGKALGWQEATRVVVPVQNANPIRHYAGTVWQYHWHRFIDHIADGKDPDDFFKALIQNV